MAIKFQDLVFFSVSQDDYARKVYEVSSNTYFPTEVRSVEHLAKYVVNFCAANSQRRQALMIGRLRVVSHGSPGRFWIGADEITVSTLADYRTAWSLVSAFMLPSKSRFEIFACRTGHSKKMVGALSKLMQGIPVVAYKRIQYGRQPGGIGPQISCTDGRCKDG